MENKYEISLLNNKKIFPKTQFVIRKQNAFDHFNAIQIKQNKPMQSNQYKINDHQNKSSQPEQHKSASLNFKVSPIKTNKFEKNIQEETEESQSSDSDESQKKDKKNKQKQKNYISPKSEHLIAGDKYIPIMPMDNDQILNNIFQQDIEEQNNYIDIFQNLPKKDTQGKIIQRSIVGKPEWFIKSENVKNNEQYKNVPNKQFAQRRQSTQFQQLGGLIQPKWAPKIDHKEDKSHQKTPRKISTGYDSSHVSKTQPNQEKKIFDPNIKEFNQQQIQQQFQQIEDRIQQNQQTKIVKNPKIDKLYHIYADYNQQFEKIANEIQSKTNRQLHDCLFLKSVDQYRKKIENINLKQFDSEDPQIIPPSIQWYQNLRMYPRSNSNEPLMKFQPQEMYNHGGVYLNLKKEIQIISIPDIYPKLENKEQSKIFNKTSQSMKTQMSAQSIYRSHHRTNTAQTQFTAQTQNQPEMQNKLEYNFKNLYLQGNNKFILEKKSLLDNNYSIGNEKYLVYNEIDDKFDKNNFFGSKHH